RNEKCVGDFLVGFTFSNQVNDFHVAFRQIKPAEVLSCFFVFFHFACKQLELVIHPFIVLFKQLPFLFRGYVEFQGNNRQNQKRDGQNDEKGRGLPVCR